MRPSTVFAFGFSLLFGLGLWFGLKWITSVLPFAYLESLHQSVNVALARFVNFFITFARTPHRPPEEFGLNETLAYAVILVMLAIYFLAVVHRSVLKCDVNARAPPSPVPVPATANPLRQSQEIIRVRQRPVARNVTCELLFFLFYGFSVWLQDTLLQAVVNAGCVAVGHFYYKYYAKSSIKGPCPTVSEQFAESTQILIIICLYAVTYQYYDLNNSSIPLTTFASMLGVFFFNTNNRLEKVLNFQSKHRLHLTFVGIMALTRINHVEITQANFPQLTLVFVQAMVFLTIALRVEAFYTEKLRILLFEKRQDMRVWTNEEVLVEYQTNRVFRDWVDQSVSSMYTEHYAYSAYCFWAELNLVFSILF